MNKFVKFSTIALSALMLSASFTACSDDDDNGNGGKTPAATGSKSRPHSLNYSRQELVYLSAVAGDLRNQCVRLEASWAGMDNVTAEKQGILEEAELEPTFDYGWSMKNAGQGGSKYKTYTEAAEELIQGCVDIVDEVANQKMGRPHSGSSEDDRNYIESPYSLNSIVDFQDNIRSIQNAYCGSNEGDASVSDFINLLNPALDAQVRSAIATAISEIGKIPEPFASTATGEQTARAIAACSDLNDLLEDDVMNTLRLEHADKNAMLQAAMEAYVDNTVIPTYMNMASAAIEMSALCDDILAKFDNGTLTTEDVKAAGDAWSEARKYWELSEAFLFGAAADYDIDPHIDSWPLDKTSMDNMLNNAGQMAQMSPSYVANNLGYGLLGFHSVEYLLFELYDDEEE